MKGNCIFEVGLARLLAESREPRTDEKGTLAFWDEDYA